MFRVGTTRVLGRWLSRSLFFFLKGFGQVSGGDTHLEPAADPLRWVRVKPLAVSTATPAIRTPDQRLRVFVSSTLQELSAERAVVSEAVRAIRLIPVMFELGARPHPPRDLDRAYLKQSDVFVGLYWQSYGWVAPSETISGLEDEYLLSGSMPKLIYIKEGDAREGRLSDLIKRIQSDDRVSYRGFTDAGELSELVKDDLAVMLTERFSQAAGAAGGRGDVEVAPAPAEPSALVEADLPPATNSRSSAAS